MGYQHHIILCSSGRDWLTYFSLLPLGCGQYTIGFRSVLKLNVEAPIGMDLDSVTVTKKETGRVPLRSRPDQSVID